MSKKRVVESWLPHLGYVTFGCLSACPFYGMFIASIDTEDGLAVVSEMNSMTHFFNTRTKALNTTEPGLATVGHQASQDVALP